MSTSDQEEEDPARKATTSEVSKETEAETEIVQKKNSAPKKKLAANNAGSAAAPIVFGSPPKRIGLSKRAEKKEVSKKELKEAKRIQNCIREGKKVRAVKLCHMEILSGPYSSSTTRPLLDRLELPSVEVVGPLVVRKYNVSQPVPVIKAIPQGEKIRKAIHAIDDKGNQDLLARWDEYGCATYGQLKLMDLVVTAQNYFKMVKATMEWIDKVEIQVDSIVEPFIESVNITKFGSEFLDFRENVWLHSGSIIGSLFMMRSTYDEVGVVNLRFLDFAMSEQRERIARSYGAAEPGVKKLISAVNLGYHWGAFYVDVEKKQCFLFDPMQLKSNITSLRTAVCTVVEPMLKMTDQIQYETITGCE
ncbi:hypothetical protein GN958_ATG21049 [Phytophthora infestans]|nr:hypothetical protein GN958_ATG21049 [Phytophthora infestans]